MLVLGWRQVYRSLGKGDRVFLEEDSYSLARLNLRLWGGDGRCTVLSRFHYRYSLLSLSLVLLLLKILPYMEDHFFSLAV